MGLHLFIQYHDRKLKNILEKQGVYQNKNHFYFIDMQGLIKMNKDFKIKKIIKILPKSEPHGYVLMNMADMLI